MIIAHIARNLNTLKVFSLTCRSWYITAVPHLHHTLTLRDHMLGSSRGELKPLSKLHWLALAPLIKEMRVQQQWTWFTPQKFSPHDLRCFSAFANVHTLKFQYLDITLFIPEIERYFGHFSPTLRSITFLKPYCTPRQLSYFLSFFSNLDDIRIRGPIRPPKTTIPDTEPVPFSTPRLRGWLLLCDFVSVEACTHLMVSGGGLQFRHMDLCRIGDCVSVLFEACAETLETLRFYAADTWVGE